MKIRTLLASACICSVAALAQQKKPELEKASPARKLAARIGVLRDGGSSVIFIPAVGSGAEKTIVVDGRSESKTKGEVYLSGTLHGPDGDGQPLPRREAEKYFQQLESVLINHFGAEVLLGIILNPVEPGIHLSEDEFVKKLETEDGFNDRLEAGYLMREIIDYRSKRGPADD